MRVCIAVAHAIFSCRPRLTRNMLTEHRTAKMAAPTAHGQTIPASSTHLKRPQAPLTPPPFLATPTSQPCRFPDQPSAFILKSQTRPLYPLAISVLLSPLKCGEERNAFNGSWKYGSRITAAAAPGNLLKAELAAAGGARSPPSPHSVL